MSLAVGIFKGSYPSRGLSASKTIGRRNAKSTNEEAFSPAVFEKASTEIPNKNPTDIKIKTFVSKGKSIKNKGNRKI